MIAPNDPKEMHDAPAAPRELPAEFRVRLEDVFAGPLDLLLHLVKEHEVEISEVSLARVCNEFLRYVKAIAELDLARAGDYLVVAATLVAMKSRALVPGSGEAVELDDEVEPGDDLVKRLLQYRRVRDISRQLGARAAARERVYERGSHEMPPLEPGEFDLGEVAVWDLLSAFARILQETGSERPTHRIRRPDRSLGDFVRDVARALASRPAVRFEELFAGAPDREWVIGTFLAILELAKQGVVGVRQPELFGPIDLARREDDAERFQRIAEGIADAQEFGGGGDGVEGPDSTDPEAGAIVPGSESQRNIPE